MKKYEKKIIKIATMVMIILMIVSISMNIFAGVSSNPTDWTGEGDRLKTGGISDWLNSIINVIALVGSAAAIIILIVLGIKYMMGSTAEKAEYKKTMMPYFIGALMVFGASALTGFIYNIMNASK